MSSSVFPSTALGLIKQPKVLFFRQWHHCRSQWPRGLGRRSAAARLLRLWVRMPPGAWMFVCCDCCVLSGRGLCDELITRPEESYRLCCVVVCDLETSWTRRPWPNGGCRARNKQINDISYSVLTVLLTVCLDDEGKIVISCGIMETVGPWDIFPQSHRSRIYLRGRDVKW